MQYLTDEPMIMPIKGGLFIIISCNESGEYLFSLDMRALVHAVPIQKLPTSMTRRMIPEICRSKIQEICTENYLSVRLISIFEQL